MQNADFDLQLFLPYLLNQAAEAAGLDFARIYKDRYGLLRTDWRVLFHLGLYGRMTAQDIGANSKTHKTKISRAVQNLDNRRYILRERDTKDRRREFLELTPLGRTVYDDLHQEARAYDAKLTQHMPFEALAQLRDQLRSLGEQGLGRG